MSQLAHEFQRLYEEGKTDSEEFWTLLYRLSKMVFDKYYPGFYKMKEDLISGAVTYSVARYRTNNYNPALGTLYNYLFTTCRNSMRNEVQKQLNYQKAKEIDISGTCFMEPDYDDMLDLIDEDPITAKCMLYYLVERSPMLLDIRDVDDELKQLFIKIVESKLTFPFPKNRTQNDVNLLLWFLFVYSGCEVKVPSTVRLSQILRQARIYTDYKNGLSLDEIAKKHEIRRNHVERIVEDLSALLEESGECQNSKKRQRGLLPL